MMSVQAAGPGSVCTACVLGPGLCVLCVCWARACKYHMCVGPGSVCTTACVLDLGLYVIRVCWAWVCMYCLCVLGLPMCAGLGSIYCISTQLCGSLSLTDILPTQKASFASTFSLWPPYGNRACHYIFALWFLSFYLFSSPNLSGRRLDVYHTSTHGVALVRIWNAGLKCAARDSLQMQDPKKSPNIAIWAPSHNFVGLYLYN